MLCGRQVLATHDEIRMTHECTIAVDELKRYYKWLVSEQVSWSVGEHGVTDDSAGISA